jgi:hypothetical protein
VNTEFRRICLARHRYARLALFPILVPIFLVGWALTVVGARKPTGKKTERKVTKAVREFNVEIGVIAEDYPELSQSRSEEKRLSH